MNREDRLQLLKRILLSRAMDETEASLVKRGAGIFHVGSGGHETLACVAQYLEPTDIVLPHYRDRAFMLARGMEISAFASAFFATRDSESSGRQMPCHFNSRDLNVWPHASVFPAHGLAACGLAWGIKRRGHRSIVTCCLGEGATRQGEFYEAICFAKQERLPVLFVVEDNGLAISVRTAGINPYKLGMIPEEMITVADVSDLDGLAAEVRNLVCRVRQEAGAHVLWVKGSRLCSHTCHDDQTIYRSAEELASLKERDPVELLRAALRNDEAATALEVGRLCQDARAVVSEVYSEVAQREPPKCDDALAGVLGPEPTSSAALIDDSQRGRIGDAVNAVFQRMLETADSTLFLGQDIEDPLGGVFRLTKGLSTSFPGRVVNAPLAEATIVGVGCGLASYGFRPVVEIQFADFFGPGWSQLINNAATLRWRSAGQWKCPMIVYAHSGAYIPGGGPWHSQQPTGALATNPGMRIAIPSTPDDAAGLFWTAFHFDDPTVILLPKHLLWKRFPVGGLAEPVGFGRARHVRTGMDISVVCWGNCVELVEEASEQLDGIISLEIIDLRSIIPWDKEALRVSLEKTGRLLVVQEENESCSPGQMIISWTVTDLDAWGSLLCQPMLLSKPDVHIGFNPVYEEYILPTRDKVIAAARRLLEL